jgi:hypothetical protein
MVIGPTFVLSLLVGILLTALYVVIRGSAGGQLLFVFIAAVLGAWAGDAISARLDFDVLRIGDFHLLGAAIVAGLGITIVALVGILGPQRRRI